MEVVTKTENQFNLLLFAGLNFIIIIGFNYLFVVSQKDNDTEIKTNS